MKKFEKKKKTFEIKKFNEIFEKREKSYEKKRQYKHNSYKLKFRRQKSKKYSRRSRQ